MNLPALYHSSIRAYNKQNERGKRAFNILAKSFCSYNPSLVITDIMVASVKNINYSKANIKTSNDFITDSNIFTADISSE